MTLRVTDLHKKFYQGETTIHALKGVEMEVGTGEIVAIVGASGSGKSTLLGLLAGLDTPHSGAVVVDGIDLYGLEEPERTSFRAKNIALVFQQFHLLPHLSALENVALPLEILGGPNEALARELLQGVGLEQRMHHQPTQLSGGECQRVALARALATAPKLLLADEPSGNLDQETSHMVMDLFFRILRERKITCLLVTHNEELAKRCDRILRLSGGKI